jgi:hypothetical protein
LINLHFRRLNGFEFGNTLLYIHIYFTFLGFFFELVAEEQRKQQIAMTESGYAIYTMIFLGFLADEFLGIYSRQGWKSKLTFELAFMNAFLRWEEGRREGRLEGTH